MCQLVLAAIVAAGGCASGGRGGAPRPPPSGAAVVPKPGGPPRHAFRGMHLDVARHFFPKSVVERYIELLAFYKLNFFHWHLTDDQGFRLELKKHPELTAIGGKDGFYTQDDVREIVAFAAARGITVIPEIEMPGHARAILAAHPELSCTGEALPVPRTWGIFADVLCAGNDAAFALIEDILDEVTSLFPGPYVHIGGDEVPKTRWSACPKCAARMEREHLDVDALHGWFMGRVGGMVASRGRRAMVWDDALGDRLPKDVIVVAWQSKERGLAAAAAGHDVVMAPHDEVYFDDPSLPWTTVRAFDPGTGPHILGGEGTLWTEHVETADAIEAAVAPRIAALADALWAGPDAAADFPARFIAHRPLLDAMGVKYTVAPPDIGPPRRAFIDHATVDVALSPLFADGAVRGNVPRVVEQTTEIVAVTVLPNGRESAPARALFEKQVPRPARSGLATGVKYTYYEDDFHRLPDFAKLSPSRSGSLDAVRLDASFRDERFAVVYELAIAAKATGVYRIVARADDGVRVLVDDEVVVIDDGEHAPRDASGEIALAAGLHAMRVEYFQGSEGKELSVRVEGPIRP